MITDEELNIILKMHGYAGSTTPHWPGCYEVHAECAIRWLVATVRELAPYAAKRIETKAVAEETREKELIKLLEHFDELMRITYLTASDAYGESYRLLRMAKGLPPEDVIFKPKRKKKPKNTNPELNHFDHEQLD